MADLISILMPVRNVEKYIKQAIESVLKQTHADFELIIIDDSTDRTADIIHNIADDRILYYKLKGNISKALNFGIEKAKGKYIARMDGDDYCHPERLSKQVKLLIGNNLDVVGCNIRIMKESGSFLENKYFPETDSDIKFYMPVNTSLPHPTLLARRDVFCDNRYNESLKYAEDMDLFLKLIDKGFIFHNLQEILYFYRLTKNYYEVFNEENRSSYEIGGKYLSNRILYSGNQGYNSDILRYALLEYYKGDLRIARKYFTEYVSLCPSDKRNLRRYLMISKLNPFIFTIFRKLKIPQIFNRQILRYFKKDLQYSSRKSSD